MFTRLVAAIAAAVISLTAFSGTAEARTNSTYRPTDLCVNVKGTQGVEDFGLFLRQGPRGDGMCQTRHRTADGSLSPWVTPSRWSR